jgi:hypothetical protein
MLAGIAFVTAISLAGCGGATMSEGPLLPTPSGVAQASAIVVTRSGGIAGFHDVVEVAADGTARVTTKNGETHACTPSAAALGELRAIDIATVGTGQSKIADGFTYEVRTSGVVATAGDGDNVGIRAAFVRAAAAVVSSCLASGSGSGFPDR